MSSFQVGYDEKTQHITLKLSKKNKDIHKKVSSIHTELLKYSSDSKTVENTKSLFNLSSSDIVGPNIKIKYDILGENGDGKYKLRIETSGEKGSSKLEKISKMITLKGSSVTSEETVAEETVVNNFSRNQIDPVSVQTQGLELRIGLNQDSAFAPDQITDLLELVRKNFHSNADFSCSCAKRLSIDLKLFSSIIKLHLFIISISKKVFSNSEFIYFSFKFES